MIEKMPDIEARTLAKKFGVAEKIEEGAFIEALDGLLPLLYPENDELPRSDTATPSDARLGSRVAATKPNERIGPKAIAAKPDERTEPERLRDWLFRRLKEAVLEAKHSPKNRMKFGTSGWRGLLLTDFTYRNVGCVTQGLVDTLFQPETHEALGVANNDELRERGCVLAYDTRICGPEFLEIAAKVLLAHGIKVIDIGMATTPEVSTAIYETHAAFSINFTPSHNPFEYHGYKFNPSDGGPAPATLTVPVAKRANEILDSGGGYRALSDESYAHTKAVPGRYLLENPVALYKASLARRLPFFDLPALIKSINDSDLEIFIDNGFGATSGKYEQLLNGVDPEKLHVFNGESDYLFGGKSREPSVENFRTLQEKMKSSKARLVIGFMNDGDGDRFVGGGREGVLVMNRFGPLVVRYLTQELGVRGDVTRSVMTSHMADAARARYLPEGHLNETAVGFQHMRPFVPGSVNSWEESDGMSPMGWSLDKDGLLAALLLTSMVLHYDRSPEELDAELEAELGPFFFERRKVAGRLAGDALKKALADRFGTFESGHKVSVGDLDLTVDRVITLDGTKVVFTNGWWFGVRPSGTEPVVRPYVETSTSGDASVERKAVAKEAQLRIMSWLCKEIERVIG